MPWLRAGPGSAGAVQAYIVAGPLDWRPLVDDRGRTVGWSFHDGHLRWAVGGGLTAPRTGDPAGATRDVLEAARRTLAQADMRLTDMARTWFFLDDILGWYDRFNAGRNQVYDECGLLRPQAPGNRQPALPASTGIGVPPACGSRLAMQVFAAAGREDCIVRHPAAARHFARAFQRTLPWPWVVVVGDVCRPDLLFEAEVTAFRRSG